MLITERWKHVGWPKEWISLKPERESIEKEIDWVKSKSITRSLKADQVLDRSRLALKEYLLGNDSNVIAVANEIAIAAEDYFFGDWRRIIPGGKPDAPPDPEFWRKHAGWSDHLRGSVMWLSSIDEWNTVERLAAYPNDEISLDCSQTEINREWLLVLFGVLSGKTIDKDLTKHVKKIRDGSKKREKLLLALLEAIIADDETAMVESSKEYFKYYRAVERRPQLITSKVAIDASILYHYARHLGRTMPVPKSGLPHLIILSNTTERDD